MDLKQLASFVAVVEKQGFSAAADALFLSQPTVSNHLRLLEEELDCELISRTTKKLEVTPTGEKIYEYDTEPRTLGLETTVLSDCAVAFCETIRAAGYEPGIYFSRHTGYYGFDLRRLEDVSMWFALPGAKYPSFYYKVDAWQYTFTGSVPGISTETDVNLFFEPRA